MVCKLPVGESQRQPLFLYVYIRVCIYVWARAKMGGMRQGPRPQPIHRVRITRRLLRQAPLQRWYQSIVVGSPKPESKSFLTWKFGVGTSARHNLLHTCYLHLYMFCIGIASASQLDHWHPYSFRFIWLWATKLLSVTTLRHGLLEKRKSATGGM